MCGTAELPHEEAAATFVRAPQKRQALRQEVRDLETKRAEQADPRRTQRRRLGFSLPRRLNANVVRAKAFVQQDAEDSKRLAR